MLIRIHGLDPIDIVSVLHYVIQGLGLDGVKVYLGEQAKSRALTDALLKNLNKGKKKSRYTDKNAKYFIARINNEVLLPQEKFYKRIDREFDRKVLIGDIPISEDENAFLQNYMRMQLHSLNDRGSIPIQLEGKSATIRFTPKHLLALQVAICKIKSMETEDRQ